MNQKDPQYIRETPPPPYSETEANPKFVIHQVQPLETVSAVALKYGIDISSLKYVNQLWNDYVIPKRYLLIPDPLRDPGYQPPNPLDEQSALIVEFRKKTKCDWNVAFVYLEDSKWDIGSALKKYETDDIWEASNSSMKLNISQTFSRGKKINK